jgi:uncharacterized protein YqjF (DUF2071 family)
VLDKQSPKLVNSNVFLTAEWRKLAFVNYEVEEQVLLKYLPPHTQLDLFDGKCFVSLVGFMFLDTKLLGFSVPFHQSFEEVNLRFYVKYNDNGIWKRGAVFIKEIVPRIAITLVANTLYKEKYQTLPMKHHWFEDSTKLAVSYSWKAQKWHSFTLNADIEKQQIISGSESEFITEHYWGYTKITNTISSEYQVGHPKWDIYPIIDYKIDVDFEMNYGKDFGCLNQAKPSSVILAEGSDIFVMKGRKINA